MQFYSTNNKNLRASLQEAVMKGLPDDNGLFMPVRFPVLRQDFLQNLGSYSFSDIAFEISHALFQDDIPEESLKAIIKQAVTFPAPVVRFDDQKFILELFHGPSLAFKDFGARFMAQLMSYFNQGESRELVILVATSGDTGGAVAFGFHQTPGIRVVILYPSGKVSLLQEKQLTTLGENITALEIQGNFDDCQALVKKAFLDKDLQNHLRLTSANSINIARLIPQSFYFFEAYKQIPDKARPIVFSVPSGNFGNLTAGLIARKLGLPVAHFIAATNANDVVPVFLQTGQFLPKPSQPTISNAMDVGNPSNFARILDLFQFAEKNEDNPEGSTWNNIKRAISGYSFSDNETRQAIKEVFDRYQYIIDPHGAVAFLALQSFQKTHPTTQGILLETAHPSKFKEEVEKILGTPVPVPDRLARLKDRTKHSVLMPNDFNEFKNWLLKNNLNG